MKIKNLINTKFFTEIANHVKTKIPNLRKSKFSTEYYLNKFVLVLTDLAYWKSLIYTMPETKTFHYKTIYNEYCRWCKFNIFVDAYASLLNKYFFKLKDIKKAKKLNLFIDSTFIINKYGHESVSKLYEYRKKNATKISIISDEYLNILGVHIPNKSTTHDVKLTQPTLDSIPINLDKFDTINLVGDKGYITQELFRLGTKNNLKILTPNKKYKNKKKPKPTINNKNKRKPKPTTKNKRKPKLTKNNIKLLKKRIIVEHAINKIKQANRLMLRKDKINKTLISFIYLRLMMLFEMKN